MPDWDAEKYHRLSDPQRAWGLKVLDRLKPRPGERILDIGCGTGRLTVEIAQQEPRAHLIAMDRSWTMVAEARRQSTAMTAVVQADAVSLPFASVFDAVFSTAAFHWIQDHEALFREIHKILRPDGRLVSQAGGGANLARLRERSGRLARDERFAEDFSGWAEPWLYAGVDDTIRRLRGAGFIDAHVWLEPAPTRFDDASAYERFVATVCLRMELARLPDRKKPEFLNAIVEMAATDDPPYTLDYWRLNIDARKP